MKWESCYMTENYHFSFSFPLLFVSYFFFPWQEEINHRQFLWKLTLWQKPFSLYRIRWCMSWKLREESCYCRINIKNFSSRLWARRLTPLGLRFLICEMGLIRELRAELVRVHWDGLQEALSSVWTVSEITILWGRLCQACFVTWHQGNVGINQSKSPFPRFKKKIQREQGTWPVSPPQKQSPAISNADPGHVFQKQKSEPVFPQEP